MTDLEPTRAFAIYLQRMKIEQSFRDCKDLLGMDRSMCKQQVHMEQLVALALLAYVVGLVVGEALRDVTYGGIPSNQISYLTLLTPPDPEQRSAKWRHFSGLFMLLKQRLRISPEQAAALHQPLMQVFAGLVFGRVRTFV